MRSLVAILCLISVAGCSSASKPGMSGNDPLSIPEISLFQTAESRAAYVEDYLKSRQTITEQDKISYLLNVVRDSGLVYYRNGAKHPGNTASLWFRWKMNHRQFRNDPIVTADDFVHRVCGHSNKTGEPYLVQMAGGRWESLEAVLARELKFLAQAILSRGITMISKPAEISHTKTTQDAVSSSATEC